MATNELLPMEDLEEGRLEADSTVGNFLAFDMADGRRVVGTFNGLTRDCLPEEDCLVIELPNGAEVHEFREAVDAAWYAPMGYRSPGLTPARDQR